MIGMKASVESRDHPGKHGRLGGGGRLYLAFGAIALLTVATTALGLYSFDRFGAVVQRTTTQTMPLVVGAERLAQRSASLAASAPSIALARDKSELEATTAELDALQREINEAMGALEGRTSPYVLTDIRRDIGALATILTDLKGLAELRFVTRQQQDEFHERVSEVRADFTDTVHPVTYGVNSLMRLFANRAGRRATKEIVNLGQSERRSTVIMLTARHIIALMKTPSFQAAAEEGRLPALHRSFLTIMADDLKGLDGDSADPELSSLARMAADLRDRESLDVDGLDRFAKKLDELTERERRDLFAAHTQAALNTRDIINQLIDTAVKDGGTSAEIRALGSHVISLLNTVTVLESTDAVFEMRVEFDRSFDALRDALAEFEKSALARRNPILAGNLRKLEEDLSDLRHGDIDPFARRAAELSLINEISDRLTEGRETSNRMAGKVERLVTGIMTGVEKLGSDTDRQHRTNSTILAVGGAFSLLAIVVIAVVTAHTSRRHEVDLRNAKDEAESASRAKSEFLSSMSHELRTPLHAVLGFAQLVATDPDHPLDEVQKEGVDRILKGGDHLLELINQVLDLARIESGTLSLSIETVAPADSLSRCLDMTRTMAERRRITVEDRTSGGELPLIRADLTRLQQVLLNLLSNAVKYNRDGGRVTLDCQPTADGRLRFTVSDTGLGIPEGKLKDLFLPFQRLGMEGGPIEGAGIGLAITRELVELMGGRVGLKSVVGKGSTIWVDLPLASEAERRDFEAARSAAPPQPDLDETPQVRPRRHLVLYVEDNPDLLQLMESIIRRLPNLEMISAHNAEMGLVLAEKERPDLILMDINLPGMNGIEARRQLTANPNTKDIPVIAISGAAMSHDIEKARGAGFFAYITKPFRISEAVKTLEKALKARA